MSSNIRLQKTCQHCGNRFTAKTTVTQFCSDTCAKRAYKQRKRNEKIEVAIKEETEKALYNPAIAQKEFLTVEEACQLINASRWTPFIGSLRKANSKQANWAEVPVFPGQLSMNYSN